MTPSVSRKFACDEVVRLTDERDAPAAKRSGRVSEANCVAAARPRVRSFRVAKVARVRARFRGVRGEKNYRIGDLFVGGFFDANCRAFILRVEVV